MTQEMHKMELHEGDKGSLSSQIDSKPEEPQDEATLCLALAQAQQELLDIERETSADFVEMLAALKKDQAHRISIAKATHARYVQSVTMLYEYERKQASDNYNARCVQLKNEMSADVRREIAQLVSTRDGVSVMDRRRRAPRGVHNDSNIIGGGLNDRSASQDPAVQAIVDWQRLEYDEKKELEALLAKAHVFPLLDKQATAHEVKSDLRSIAQVVVSAHVDRSKKSDLETELELELEAEDAKLQQPLDYSCMQQIENETAKRYDGQQVAVFRDQSLVLEGVLTALTETQAFVMTQPGGFKSIDRREWASGQLKVMACAPES